MMTLLTLHKYLNKQKNIHAGIINTLYPIINNIITSKSVQIGIKIVSYDMIIIIVNRSQPNTCAINFVKTCIQILGNNVHDGGMSGRVLDVLFNLYKYKDQEIGQHV